MFEFTYPKIIIFWLIATRVAALIFIAPVFASPSFNNRAKVVFVVVISWILTVINAENFIAPEHPSMMAVFAFQEIIVGLTLGFFIRVLYIAFKMAFDFMGVTMMFQAGQFVDPSTGESESVITWFGNMLVTLIFLSIGGHRLVISSLVESFHVIPFGSVVLDGAVVKVMVHQVSYSVEFAMKIAAPVLAATVFTNCALGMMARVAPQMNVFVMGFIVIISVGCLVLISALPSIGNVFVNKLNFMFHQIPGLLNLLKS